jgi:subtilisin family serine protease
VVAPGERILSTMPTYPVYLTSDALPPEERFEPSYDYMSGTSQATPYVSALAALLFSAHPGWDAGRVSAAITGKAVDIYPRHPDYFRQLKLLGSGRIDACAALGGPLLPDQGDPLGRLLTAPRLLLTAAAACVCLLALLAATTMLLLAGRRRTRPALAGAAAAQALGQPWAPAPPISRSNRQPATPAVAPTRPVTVPAHWGRLAVSGGAAVPRSYTLAAFEALIGRAPDCAVLLEGDATVSRRHARLSLSGGQVVLEDLGSSHGTFVNNRRIDRPTLLRPGDTIGVGQTLLHYEQL